MARPTWPAHSGTAWDDSTRAYLEKGGLGIVNPLHPTYGAVGDNATNNSTAFQAAIDVGTGATNDEVDIRIPAGRYKFNSTLNFSTKRVRFLGVGRPIISDPRHGTTLITNTNGMTLLNIDAGGTTNFGGLTFENLGFFDGALASTIASITNTCRVTFRDCIFYANANTDGTKAWTSTFPGGGDSSWHTIENCTFYNITNAIAPVKCLGATVSNCDFVNCNYNIDLAGNAASWKVSNLKCDGGQIRCLGTENSFTNIHIESTGANTWQYFLIDWDGTASTGQKNTVHSLRLGGASGISGLKIGANASYNLVDGVETHNFSSEAAGYNIAGDNEVRFLYPHTQYGRRYLNGTGEFVQSANPGTSGIAAGSTWRNTSTGAYLVFQSGAWKTVTTT